MRVGSGMSNSLAHNSFVVAGIGGLRKKKASDRSRSGGREKVAVLESSHFLLRRVS